LSLRRRNCVLSPRRQNFGFLRFCFLETKVSWVQKWKYFGIFWGSEINMGGLDSNFLLLVYKTYGLGFLFLCFLGKALFSVRNEPNLYYCKPTIFFIFPDIMPQQDKKNHMILRHDD
jgi:hypothetical protein